jgi:hypothetical protein
LVVNLGLLHAGDPFSGALTWDTTDPTNACPTILAYSICRPLLSLTLNLPAGDGLSIPSLPDPKAFFAGALYQLGDPPRRAEARFDLARFQILRLDRLESLHISAIGRIDSLRIPRNGKLRAHVAAEIPVGSLPFAALRTLSMSLTLRSDASVRRIPVA